MWPVCAPVGPTCHPANLTPASGRQDHTILPSAASISRQRAGDRSQVPKNPPCDPIARKTLPHPPHPVPYVRDDRDTPLCGVGRLQLIEMFLPGTEAKNFLKWDSTTAQIIGPSRSNKLHGPPASGSIHPAVASPRPIAPDEAEPVFGRAFARPVGFAERIMRPRLGPRPSRRIAYAMLLGGV
jgi:hypothetical protein